MSVPLRLGASALPTHCDDAASLTSLETANTLASNVSTPGSSVSSAPPIFGDLQHYISLGTLHINGVLPNISGPILESTWVELVHSGLPDELRAIIGLETAKLLDARWIRLFKYQHPLVNQIAKTLTRVYLLPEDWSRRNIDRNSKNLRMALRRLLEAVDVSPEAWTGDPRDDNFQHFDPWASGENVSLYYLFNKLPSPAPEPNRIRNRYTRAAVRDLLQSAQFSEWEEHGEQPLAGLRTRLYSYQARSASLMIQREAEPQLKLDPRLEHRQSPDGKSFYFGARDGSFLQEPRFYESNRGGILAETMGLGKTIICLAVILTTKGHLPQIPATYFPPPRVRTKVGSLSDMAAAVIGRYSIPARALVEQAEASHDAQYGSIKAALDHSIPFYEIPPDVPRMNRKTQIPLPRQLIMCSSTIIVVPRNLLHQWQSEVRKHVLKGGLRILVVDSVSKRASKTKAKHLEEGTMDFVDELPQSTELMKYDVLLFTRNRFELEIHDGADGQGRRQVAGATVICDCPYIGATRIRDCNCVTSQSVYESPLKKLHWLRIIIDEGHSFSSAVSNAVLVAKQISAERRWVVSGSKW